MTTSKRDTIEHAFIPDTQITPDSDITHIVAAGRYLADKRPDKVIIIGDWWDMKSLCSYDKPGSKGWEDKNVAQDFEVGSAALGMFLRTLRSPRGYSPEVHFMFGNHENRVRRAREDPHNRRFIGFLSDDQFELRKHGVIAHDFLDIVELDGVYYSHYFMNPASLYTNPIGGTIENKLHKLGVSFSMGHQQHKQSGSIYTATGQRRCGLVCGRFYQEELEYLGPQKNNQSWSGIVYKHEVQNGQYDLMEVSMNYLLERWG